jgi:hypothetical protein
MSDVKRWSNIDSYNEVWNTRTKLIASLIEPNVSIIEFGAGLNPVSKYLPDTNHYTITDFVNKEGFVCMQYDLNANKMVDFGNYDYAVFSGVLEYILNLPSKIKYISTRCKNIITSYSTINNYPDGRVERGWVNSYTDDEFIKLFNDANMELVHFELWKNQHIYKFSRHEI